MMGASIGVAQAYFGKPISCMFTGTLNEEVANDYCWMHGSAYIPPEYQVKYDLKKKVKSKVFMNVP